MRNRILAILGVFLLISIGLYLVGVRMTRADLAISAAAEPILCPGGVVEGEYCSAGTIIPITNSLIMTVIVDILLVLTIIFGVRNMQIIPRGFQNVIELVVEGFYNFAQSVDRKNIAKFFPLCASIFFFVLYSNYFALVPGVGSIGVCRVVHAEATEGAPAEGAQEAPAEGAAEEPHITPSSTFAGLPGYCEEGHVVPFLRSPSADLNVTLAWALAAVFAVELFGFQALGLNYLTKFFNFREGFMGAFVGILELISELVRIIAFSFRLFGNIFAGEVVLAVMAFLFPYLLPLPFYGLEVFVAFMQAFIFAVLTLVFMSLATLAHGGHDEHGHEAPMPIEAADLPGHGGSH
jgi:F-type H+-transporting ATPase subunit a